MRKCVNKLECTVLSLVLTQTSPISRIMIRHLVKSTEISSE